MRRACFAIVTSGLWPGDYTGFGKDRALSVYQAVASKGQDERRGERSGKAKFLSFNSTQSLINTMFL
ncbi:MAG: hypothetical protein CVV41_22545 [Candidatus Riflebacteria bacterium HGW-Riflebacteria-1]|nr:MAG: hypothetical protein CVV41_22545 [Candidatus Riflebacteria bacterium HGW-Riflebacteria-1]